jgi:hypothetical protein
MSRRQLACGCDYGLACRQSVRIVGAPDFAAGCDDRWTTSTMDRAINATATQQTGIRSVNNRVDVLPCNIADHHADACTEKVWFNWRVHQCWGR